MKIWAIADLHLSFSRPKPMDVFGDHWRDHPARIERAWRNCVAEEDVVCLPGDLSWALRLPEVGTEMDWLGRLPGRKVLVKGNHDYWWSSLSRVRRALPEDAFALQNSALLVGGVGFAGARGWVDGNLDFAALIPPSVPPTEAQPLIGIQGEQEDRRIYRREVERLETSLKALAPDAGLRVALLHFPPTSPGLEETPVTRLLERYRIDIVVFGHLHDARANRFQNPYGVRAGVTYYLVSADFVDFAPLQVATAS